MRHVLGACLVVALGTHAAAQTIDNFTFTLEKLGGGPLRSDDFKENILIVDLWGTWCGPCKEAVPHLQRIYAKYKHYGLEIVGLNYERGPREQQVTTARKFAAEHGITYPLALGDPAVQRQVPDFRGYPTLLMFNRGLAFSQLHVGFAPGQEKEIERWVREALQLPVEAGKPAEAGVDAEAIEDAEAVPEAATKSDVPAGAIFKPGDGDKGFDFEATDIDGQALRFKDLRGKLVFLALTTTWDPEAVNTAALLNKLHAAAGDKAHVLAASFERAADEPAKVIAIREFAAKHEIAYRVFPASLGFYKKIHLFGGVPMFLAFDAEGTLVLRESGLDAEVFDRLSALIH